MKEPEIVMEVWKHFVGSLGEKDYRLYLFGSRAEGTANSTSDFDFLVKGEAPVPEPLWLQLLEKIENLKTLHHIDLVDFNRTSNEFRAIAGKSMKEVRNGRL